MTTHPGHLWFFLLSCGLLACSDGSDPGDGGLVDPDGDVAQIDADPRDGPRAESGPRQVVLAGEEVTLDGSRSETQARGPITSFEWTSLDPSVILRAENTAHPTFEAPMVSERETFTFELTVWEGDAFDQDTVEITVVADLPFNDFGGVYHGVYVDVRTRRAYVAQGEGGLGIYDIMDTGAPRRLGGFNSAGNVVDVVVREGLAYLADQREGLLIVDVSEPEVPTLVGSVATTGQTRSLALHGDYAYVCDYSSGLVVVDIADGSNPNVRFTYDTDGRSQGIALTPDGLTAYVADRTSLLVFDISDKTVAPVLRNAGMTTAGHAQWVTLHESTAYVADGVNGVLTFDISDTATAPRLIHTAPTNEEARRVRFDTDRLLVSEYHQYGQGALSLWSTVDRTPSLVSRLETSAEDAVFYGDTAVLADGFHGLKILDLSRRPLPSLSAIATVGRGLGVDVQGEHAFVADFFNGLVILDVSNPFEPGYVTHYYFEGARDVVVDGNYAYLASGREGLRVVDVSNPAMPAEVAQVQLGPNSSVARSVVVRGGHAYLAADTGGIFVIDVSDPTGPLVRGSQHFGADTSAAQSKDAWVTGDFAIVANGSYSFAISDIHTPDAPTNAAVMLADAFDETVTRGDGHGIAVWGDYAFLAHHGAGLAVIDISDPTHPILVREVRAGLDRINTVRVVDDFLYAHNSDVRARLGHLLVWHLSDPPNLPNDSDVSVEIGGRFPGLDVEGAFLFLAGDSFRVLDVSDPLAPRQ